MTITDNTTATFKTDIYFRGDMRATAGGDLMLISGLANLKQALFNRLITVPGTLVGLPNYGVGIRQYQNAPNSFTLQQKLAALIEEQFLQDPRVMRVTSVAISSGDTTPQLAKIAVNIVPVGYTEQQMVFMPFNGGDTGQ